MNNEDLLFSKLLEETCTPKLEKDKPNNFSDLRNYFEKKLNEVEFYSLEDYFKNSNIVFYEIYLLKNTSCFRLKIKNDFIDFPSNWSSFSNILSSPMILIDSENDNSGLLDIFSEQRNIYEFIILLNIEGKFFLVFVNPTQALSVTEWVDNYLKIRLLKAA